MDFTDLQSVIAWIAGIGAPTLIGMALSYVAEHASWWNKLNKWVKFFVPPLLACLLALGANILLDYTDIIKQLAPYYQIIASTIIAWMSMAGTHIVVKKGNVGTNKISK